MKNWFKRKSINILVASVIAIPLSIYGISQQPFESDAKIYGIETEVAEETEETETSVTVEPMESVTVAEPEQPTEQPSEPTYISLGEFKLTAYCKCEECCGRWATDRPKDENGNDIVIGSEGTVLEPLRSIAVDTSVIPYGTVISIYDREFVAQDTGGGVKGNHIDIYFSSHEETIAFGVQYAEVFLVEGGESE